MKTQVLLLIALICSPAFSQLTGDTAATTVIVGEDTNTQHTYILGYDTNDCGVQKGDGSGNDADNPVPFILSNAATANTDCVPKALVLVGSYLYGIFLSDAHQLITATTSRSGTTTTTEYTTFRDPVVANTVYALRLDGSSTANFGKITKGYIIGTRTTANGLWGGITDVTAANFCRHYLVLTVNTANGDFLTDETGAPTSISGTGVQLAINTRTEKWTAYAAGTDVCAAIEALPEEEAEEEENSASILSLAALAALGVIAIRKSNQFLSQFLFAFVFTFILIFLFFFVFVPLQQFVS